MCCRLHDYVGVCMCLQRHCRGFVQRQRFQTRMSSVITLQSGIRKMIALRRYNRLKIEVSIVTACEPPYMTSLLCCVSYTTSLP